MIYLDHHAATPMGPEVREVVARARDEAWANPGSVHGPGRAARATIERARDEIARAIGAHAADVVLTAGGTEACNLGVLGVSPLAAMRVVTSAIEHPAIVQAIGALERSGASVIRLGVPRGVAPDEAELDAALEGCALAVLGWVNHETGTVLPMHDYAARCRARGVPLVVDATQALGKIAVDAGALDATAMALASSKVGGPPGAGALWIRRDAVLSPRMLGGAQERGRRGGTPDAAALAGFGAACARVGARLEAMSDVGRRRDRLEAALVALGAQVNSAEGARVSTVCAVSVPGWRGPSLVAALDLDGLAVSSGAACSSGLDEPSPVVGAMYPDEPWRARSALRLSLAPSTTDDEVDAAIAILRRVIPRARGGSTN